MNAIRIFLIVALAINAYLILMSWQKDYQKNPDIQQVSQDLIKINDDNKKLHDLPVVTNLNPTVGTSKNTESKKITVKSDVLEVQIDLLGGDLAKALLLQYPKKIENQKDPFVLLDQDAGYQYIIQSGFLGASGKDLDSNDLSSGRPLYKAAAELFEMKGDSIDVPLKYEIKPGLIYTKTFKFTKGSYKIEELVTIENKSPEKYQGRYFSQIKRNNADDPSIGKKSIFSLATYLGFSYWLPDDPFNKISLEEVEELQLQNKPVKFTHDGGWVSFIQHYFLSAIIPDKTQAWDYFARKNTSGDYIFGFVEKNEVVVSEQSTKSILNTYYLGPKIQKELSQISPGLELSVDYGVLYAISKGLFQILDWFHDKTQNWGWSIILLTLLVKAVFYYPSAISYRSTAKMKKIQPQIVRLKELHGSDHQKMSQEMMQIYKKEGVNPLGGCLPILLQMPVFLALYWTLLESVELRHADFIFWLKDLSVMDPYFVLPILMGASMYIQTAMSTATSMDPMQEKVMKMMPIIFTVFFLFMPSGLVLYWLTNNILSILQQWIITKQVIKA